MNNTKLEKLREKIASKGKILVAFSGGVDSGLLLKIAHDLLGENVFIQGSGVITARRRVQRF